MTACSTQWPEMCPATFSGCLAEECLHQDTRCEQTAFPGTLQGRAPASTRGQTSSKFCQCSTIMTFLPFSEPKLCSLQQGLDLNLGVGGLLGVCFISVLGIVVALYSCYFCILQNFYVLANAALPESANTVSNSLYQLLFKLLCDVCLLTGP